MDDDTLHRERLLRASIEQARRLSLKQNLPASRRKPDPLQWKRAALGLVHEIVGTAECIDRARDEHGKLIFRSDAQWILLSTLERWGCSPSISEIARRLRTSRQAARELVVTAARAGLVELLTCPADRRIVQVALTDCGRWRLEDARAAESGWVIVLLNGLETREMQAVSHVLRVIRLRLLRDERELAR